MVLDSSPSGAPDDVRRHDRAGARHGDVGGRLRLLDLRRTELHVRRHDYEFTGWSDGGARAHNITIPSTDMTLIATYRPQVWFEGETMAPTPNDGVAVRTIAERERERRQHDQLPHVAELRAPSSTRPRRPSTRSRCGCAATSAARARRPRPSRSTASRRVRSTSRRRRFTDYALPLDASNGGAAGTHTVKVEFDNNLNNGTCDRNIYLDKVTFRQVPSAAADGLGVREATGRDADVRVARPRLQPLPGSPNRSHGAP